MLRLSWIAIHMHYILAEALFRIHHLKIYLTTIMLSIINQPKKFILANNTEKVGLANKPPTLKYINQLGSFFECCLSLLY